VIVEPGLELDTLVAEKVMGWTRIGGHYAWATIEGETRTWKGFQPSTDISAAWEVVTKMLETVAERNPLAARSASFIFSLSRYGTRGWGARFLIAWPCPTSCGESAAHAICLAALKAVGYTHETAS
jgi:hypothetical protein